MKPRVQQKEYIARTDAAIATHISTRVSKAQMSQPFDRSDQEDSTVVIHPKNFHLFYGMDGNPIQQKNSAEHQFSSQAVYENHLEALHSTLQPEDDITNINLKSELMKIASIRQTQRDKIIRRRDTKPEPTNSILNSFEYPSTRPGTSRQHPPPLQNTNTANIENYENKIGVSYSTPNYFKHLGPKDFRQAELSNIISRYTNVRHHPPIERDVMTFYPHSSYSTYISKDSAQTRDYFIHHSIPSVQTSKTSARQTPISSKIINSTLNFSPGLDTSSSLQLKASRFDEQNNHQAPTAHYNN